MNNKLNKTNKKIIHLYAKDADYTLCWFAIEEVLESWEIINSSELDQFDFWKYKKDAIILDYTELFTKERYWCNCKLCLENVDYILDIVKPEK